MKKHIIVFLVFTLVACSSNEVSDEPQVETTINSNSSDTTQTTQKESSNESTDTSVVENYVFDNEKMSPFTGIELSPEIWLKDLEESLLIK